MSRAFLFILGLFFWAPVAQARVFSFQTHRVAAYFKGTAGVQDSAKTAFGNSSGSNTGFRDEVDYNFSGDVGFVWNLSQELALRVGAEFVQTKNLDVVGRDAGGTKVLDLTTSAKAFNPHLTFEFILKEIDNLRYTFYAGAGWAQATVTNEYSNNTTGTGDSAYKEVVRGSDLSYHAGLGMEFLLVDNVTMMLDAGYRFLVVGELDHEDTVNTVNGVKTSGSRATENNGSSRDVNLNGAYFGLNFRFYIPPLNY